MFSFKTLANGKAFKLEKKKNKVLYHLSSSSINEGVGKAEDYLLLESSFQVVMAGATHY